MQCRSSATVSHGWLLRRISYLAKNARSCNLLRYSEARRLMNGMVVFRGERSEVGIAVGMQSAIAWADRQDRVADLDTHKEVLRLTNDMRACISTMLESWVCIRYNNDLDLLPCDLQRDAQHRSLEREQAGNLRCHGNFKTDACAQAPLMSTRYWMGRQLCTS